MDAAHAWHEATTASSGPVLVCATSETAEQTAMAHAVRLFGSHHPCVAHALDTPGIDVRAICDAVEDRRAVAVILGLGIGGRDRASSVARLVRRCSCPVVVVAAGATQHG